MATDFSVLISKLKECGYTDQDIADAAEIDRTMIMRLRKGERKQPTYDVGAAIVALHKKAINRRKE